MRPGSPVSKMPPRKWLPAIRSVNKKSRRRFETESDRDREVGGGFCLISVFFLKNAASYRGQTTPSSRPSAIHRQQLTRLRGVSLGRSDFRGGLSHAQNYSHHCR